MVKSVINNRIVKRYLLPILVAVIYFCMEPLLGQICMIRSYSIVYYPYRVLKTSATVLLPLWYLYKAITGKTKLSEGLIFPIFCVYLCYLIPIVINGFTNINIWVDTVVQLIAYYVLLSEICEDREVKKEVIRYISWVYFIIAAINLAFCFFPQMLSALAQWNNETFITRIENQAGFPLVMGLLFALLDQYYNKSGLTTVKTILYFAVYFISIYLMWTAAQVIGAMILLLYMLPFVRKYVDRVHLHYWVIVSFALFITFTWFWEPIMEFGPVKFLIVDVLKKDMTFTGRLEIWQGVSEMIKESPIIGHGLMENPQMLYFDTGFNNDWAHAHSIFLQTLYEGGIVTLTAVAGVLVYASKLIKKNKNNELMGIFKIIVFVFLMNLEMDQFFIYPWRSCLWCMIFGVCNFAVLVGENED